jgi:hypothetical protein
MGDPQQHQSEPARPPAPAPQTGAPQPGTSRLVSLTVLLGAIGVVPPVVLYVLAVVSYASGSRWASSALLPFAGATLVSFFVALEALTRGRKELRHPPEERPRHARLGMRLGTVGVVLPLLAVVLYGGLFLVFVIVASGSSY